MRTESEAVIVEGTMTVATVNIANGDNTTLKLPVGEYEVIASSYGLETQIQSVTVDSGQDN